MGFLFEKQKEVVLTIMAKLAIVAFLTSFSSAFVSTIWAIYIDSFINNISLVGFVSSIFTITSFCAYFFLIPIIEKFNKAKLYSYSILGFGIAYILFAINKNFYLFFIIALFLSIIGPIRYTSWGILVKDYSQKKKLSRNEGFMYTISNIAWVLGPLIAGYLVDKYDFNFIFVLSSLFIFISFFIFKIYKINNHNIKKKIDGDILKNFFDFFKDKNRRYAYFLKGGISVWWVLIYLFIPLYIIRNGLGPIWIGYFLFGICVPLVLFEVYFSKLAEKKGFKFVFKLGYIIPAILAFVCFFISNIYLILFLLILASIGISMVEPTTEAYFFDNLKNKKEELRFYGPFRTHADIHNVIAKVIVSSILLFVSFRFIFIFFGLVMLGMYFLTNKIKDVVESKL